MSAQGPVRASRRWRCVIRFLLLSVVALSALAVFWCWWEEVQDINRAQASWERELSAQQGQWRLLLEKLSAMARYGAHYRLSLFLVGLAVSLFALVYAGWLLRRLSLATVPTSDTVSIFSLPNWAVLPLFVWLLALFACFTLSVLWFFAHSRLSSGLTEVLTYQGAEALQGAALLLEEVTMPRGLPVILLLILLLPFPLFMFNVALLLHQLRRPPEEQGAEKAAEAARQS